MVIEDEHRIGLPGIRTAGAKAGNHQTGLQQVLLWRAA